MKKYLFLSGILIGFLVSLSCFADEGYYENKFYRGEQGFFKKEYIENYFPSAIASASIEQAAGDSLWILFEKGGVDFHTFFNGKRNNAVLELINDELEKQMAAFSSNNGGHSFVMPLRAYWNPNFGLDQEGIQNVQYFSKIGNMRALRGESSAVKLKKNSASSAACFMSPSGESSLASILSGGEEFFQYDGELPLPPKPLPIPPPLPRFFVMPIMIEGEDSKLPLPPKPLPIPPPLPRFFVMPIMIEAENSKPDYSSAELYFVILPAAVPDQKANFATAQYWLEKIQDGYEGNAIPSKVKEGHNVRICNSKGIVELAFTNSLEADTYTY
ncbi:MAG: hypothetical protein OXB86_05810 [Bdellovibrionales bacterium]|nr:hypothetical protein [Bdellovibrionales bacterium]